MPTNAVNARMAWIFLINFISNKKMVTRVFLYIWAPSLRTVRKEEARPFMMGGTREIMLSLGCIFRKKVGHRKRAYIAQLTTTVLQVSGTNRMRNI